MSYLESAVEYHEDQAMWPTPRVSDYKGSGPKIMRDDGKSRMDQLMYAVEQTSEIKGSLNPEWVCWLMGGPVGWVSIDPLPKERYDEWLQTMTAGSWWDEERGLPRAAPAGPRRVDMLKALGNGIVPQCIAVFMDKSLA